MTIRPLPLLLSVLLPAVGACGNPRLDEPWCADSPPPVTPPWSETPTYHQHVAPILDARCVGCHVDGGVGPFPLDDYAMAFAYRDLVARATALRTMPPFLAADCCTEYHNDFSLTDAEIETTAQWVISGGLEGDPDAGPAMTLAPVGGLSRVDVTLEVAETYTLQPQPGRADDFRCFLVDWPVDREVFITGLNPVPGNRAIVHHLIVAALTGDAIETAEELDAEDEGSGFDCQGGLGTVNIRDVKVLGGSLLGSDFPDGLGTRVAPGSKILINIHYFAELERETYEDRTAIQIRYDETAREFEGLAVANPAWIVDDGMRIEAGESDAAFWFGYEPSAFTRGDPVLLRSVTPHMHYFGKRMRVMILREDGSTECLLEIPRWDFGWEQPFWFVEPKLLRPGDELYVECIFDNSAGNQPYGSEPRDIAWGADNQDMCAAFASFTRGME